MQLDPGDRARFGVAQLDLGRPYAHRREADDAVGPPVMGDGVSDQHVPQFASPQETSISASACIGLASTRRRYGSGFASRRTSQYHLNLDAASGTVARGRPARL